MGKYDLETRLVMYASRCYECSKKMIKVETFPVLSKQLYRSSTSVALNYGEAQAAESQRDFIHKLRLSLKELRETRVTLRIISVSQLLPTTDLESLLSETEELTSIFVSSIKTATKNSRTE